MRLPLLWACLFLSGTSLAAQAAGLPPAPAGWKLIWHDEFDRDGLVDPTKWSYDVGGDGWGNAELETYCAPGSAAAPCDPSHPTAVMVGIK